MYGDVVQIHPKVTVSMSDDLCQGGSGGRHRFLVADDHIEGRIDRWFCRIAGCFGWGGIFQAMDRISDQR